MCINYLINTSTMIYVIIEHINVKYGSILMR
jgi:hypothetical protein